jgi:hypothetical protein
VTLAAAALELAYVPARIVEPLIAASLVYIGLENILRQQVMNRCRVTFAFGLLHGFGFAGALRETGIGSGAAAVVPLASFNVGVEVGQLAIALAILPMVRCISGVPILGRRIASLCSALVAMAGSYWFIERTLGP